ncbi:MAG: transglycosylase family protein, partial [Nocardioidaceae bacterium]
STWRAFGGGKFARYAHRATPSQQIRIAEKVLRAQGWGAWPSCSSKLGLR